MAKDKQAKKDAVVVYGAEWCAPCHALKNYLKSKKVDYKYINVDNDREAGVEIYKKTGWTAIPITKIGEEYILGFDIEKVNGALRASKLLA